jgi:hypothetical protein
MGEDGEDDGEPIASMDLCEQRRTWRLFLRLLRWGAVCCAVLLLFLLLFRAHS